MTQQQTEKRPVELKILTGMSGAGKTQAIHVLEDLGYYCVDNLPPNLFLKFAEVVAMAAEPMSNVALVVDARGGEFLLDLYGALSQLREKHIPYQIVFLEASDEVLVRRFKETRRRHPLAAMEGMSILDAIAEERRRLEEIRGVADVIIDTTSTSAQELKDQLLAVFAQKGIDKLWISVNSFGFKYGIPIDADLVMDVRFLPNPYYVPELKECSGLETGVQDYVLRSADTQDFLRRYLDLLISIIPLYVKEGKKNLTIAIGCTGGRHRSVTIASYLAKELAAREDLGVRVSLSHRDINKDNVQSESLH